MNFVDWVELRMKSEAVRSLDQSPPLSRAGFQTLSTKIDDPGRSSISNKIPHREYQPKNFDRYSFKASEEKTKEYAEQMKKVLFHQILLGSEALAGFYDNDEIVKALDDYITRLSQLGIKLG